MQNAQYIQPTPPPANPLPAYITHHTPLHQPQNIPTQPWNELFISQAGPDGWVIITNISYNNINLHGWKITNSPGAEQPLPNHTLPPGESLRVATENFPIRTRGETLMLFDPEGFITDIFVTGTLRTGVSALRLVDDISTVLLTTPQTNNTYTGFTLPAEASHDDLVITYGTQITLTTRTPHGQIFYTLNGDEPTQDSFLYTQPMTITQNTILRARVFSEGRLPSAILTRTFLLENPHSLPVVTLATPPEGLFSHTRGIFADGPRWVERFPHRGANFWQRWHRDTHFAFYEDSRLRAEADAQMRVFGAHSRAFPQKSLAVFFRGSHGLTHLAYPMVPHTNRDVWDSLLLRTSGQDWDSTKLRDAFIHTALDGVTHLTVMAAAPVVLYINAQYWGLYNLREKFNDDLFRLNQGVPNCHIDILRGNGNRISAGCNRDYRAMYRTLTAFTDMNSPEAYDFINANIDLDNWIDYWIVNTYFGNSDTSNIRFYRIHAPYGCNRWRWQLFDQDYALRPHFVNRNPFTYVMLNPYGHGTNNTMSTAIARALMQNDIIRERFLHRYAYLMDNVLSTERMLGILGHYAELIASEIPRQAQRWRAPSSYAAWRRNVNQMRDIIENRPAQIQRFMRSAFRLSAEDMANLFPRT
jgi:hypothetical protein